MKKNCDNCKYDAWDYVGHKPCENCISKGDEPPSFWEASENYIPMTNADRIRAMSDEELAEDFCKTVLGVMEQLGIENTGSMEDAVRVRLEWLKQPAEVDNG